jgi:glycosyltransferase 2 family protein
VSWFKLFVYLSIAFLVGKLAGDGYLTIPQLHSPAYLLGALLALFAGFLFEPLPWRRMLTDADMPVDYRTSLISCGLSVFGKYIPGKLWAVAGRTWYVAQACGYPQHRVGLVALNAQVAALWAGLLVGASTLLHGDNWHNLGIVTLVTWLALTMILLSDVGHRIATSLARALKRPQWEFPRVRAGGLWRSLPWYAAQWAFWCVGFLLLAQAFSAVPLPLYLAWAFALAAVLGMLAVLVPAGLGIREGVLVLALVGAGLTTTEATTTAAVARLWFTAGEVFIFFLAFWLSRRSSSGSDHTPPRPS